MYQTWSIISHLRYVSDRSHFSYHNLCELTLRLIKRPPEKVTESMILVTLYKLTHAVTQRGLNSFSIPYSGKVWQGESLVNWLCSSLWWKKVWRINRSANRLLLVSTNLDGFNLANYGQFTKFAKLSPRQTFPLYGSCYIQYSNIYVRVYT